MHLLPSDTISSRRSWWRRGLRFVGPDFVQKKKADVDGILEAFPGMQLKASFLKTCANVIPKHRAVQSRSFMPDVGYHYLADFHLPISVI
jgi:hypothetical protein